MAKFNYNISPEFMKSLGKLSEVEKHAPKMIDEAIPILETHVRSEISRHVRTGELANSIKVSKAKKSPKGGYYGSVYPDGESLTQMDNKGITRMRKEPVRNMEKLAYLEYGTSKQAAAPTITKAINDSEEYVLSKMQEVFNREVGAEDK